MPTLVCPDNCELFMQFIARTLSSQNVISEIIFEAENEADARQQLIEQSLKPLSLYPANSFAKNFSWSSRTKQQKFSILLFSQELLALLKAGLSLVEALEGLVEKESRSEAKRIINGLLSALREGKRFSVALQAQPSVFPTLYIGLVQAAESTGHLPQTLERYIQYQQRIDIVRSKIISASLYPLILLIVGTAVTGFLIGYVVPRFAVVYQGTGRTLPLLSQWLMLWGQYVARHGQFLLFTIIGLFIIGFSLLRLFIRKGGFLKLIRSLPSIGERYRLYLLSRLYLTLGMLLQGGMSIIPALLNARTVIPKEWQKKIEAAQFQIEAGQSLSYAFSEQGLITPITLRMLRVGEQTGQLGNMLQQAAEFYEGDISRFIERFMRTFEPVVMAIIGLVVGLIVVLLYMPIFDLAGSLQ